MVLHSASSKGGAALAVSAAIALLMLIVANRLFPDAAPAMAWVMVGFVTVAAFVTGCLKLLAPEHALTLTPQHLTLHFAKGELLLPWQEIAWFSQLQLAGAPMNYIGIRLMHYQGVLSRIPLRLAVRLTIEQQPLIVAGLRQHCPSGQCPAEQILRLDDVKLENLVWSGVQAMFAHRMTLARQLYQVDLLIPADCLEFAPEELSHYLNQQRLQYQAMIVSGQSMDV